MSTLLETKEPTFEIIASRYGIGYMVLRNGIPLETSDGHARVFATRSGARKRIHRERTGDFHK